MKRYVWLIAVLLTAILPAFIAGQTAEQPVTDAPYGYVELAGPRPYNIVKGDTLWDLTPNQWRVLQAANAKLNDATRISTTATGLYRVLLKETEEIQIPAGLTVRVRLERPTNFVDNPVTGGRPFVQGGVNPAEPNAIRDQLREAALREFNQAYPGANTVRREDFEIVGDHIELGTLHGPGIVFFADRPNEGRPTMYNGERGYRAMMRNRRTGQLSEQMFLQGCGNDARQGNFLRAGGEGFRFVPDGTLPSIPPPVPTNNTQVQKPRSVGLWPFVVGGLVGLAIFGALGFLPVAYRPGWFLPLPAAATVAEEPPAPAEASAPEPAAEQEPAEPEPQPAPLALASARTEPEMATAVVNGTTYRYSPEGTLHVEKGGRVRIEGAAVTETIAPERTRPKRTRNSRRLPGTATGTTNE